MFDYIDSPDERIARWRQRVVTSVHTTRLNRVFSQAAIQCDDEDQQQLAVQGWRHLHHDHVTDAIRYFQAALHHDPYAVGAWVGLSQTTASLEERRRYLQIAVDLQMLLQDRPVYMPAGVDTLQ